MKEIKTILNQLQSASSNGIKTAIATVVNVHGSSYRRTGARMLIQEDGFWFGSVSGGCLEGDVINKAKEVIQNNKSQLYKYDTRQNAKNSFGMGYGCNGLLEILIEPIAYTDQDRNSAILKQLVEESNMQGLSTIFYTEDSKEFEIGQRMHSNGMNYISHPELANLVRADLKEIIEAGEAKSKTYKFGGKKVKVFHEVFRPNINILIYGAVFHVVPFLKITNEIDRKSVV